MEIEYEYCTLEGILPDPCELSFSDLDFAFHQKMVKISANGTLQMNEILEKGSIFYLQCPMPPFHLIHWEIIKKDAKKLLARNTVGAVCLLKYLGNFEYATDLPLQTYKL
jgi:hypothetical protein